MENKSHSVAPPPDEVIRIGDQFYVLATTARAHDRTFILKHDETFGVFDRQGDIRPVGNSEQGLFHEGTRFLSRYELLLNGARPLLLSAMLDQDNLLLSVDLTNPDISQRGDVVAPRGTLHLQRTRILWQGALRERIAIQNFGRYAFPLALTLRFDVDFADIFEVRGIRRARRGERFAETAHEHRLEFCYRGLDEVVRCARVTCHPTPARIEPGQFVFEGAVAPAQQFALELQVACRVRDSLPPHLTFVEAERAARRRVQQLRMAECEVSTSNDSLNELLSRSRADLRLMLTETREGPYPYAGVPWFSAPFGRDGIVTALQTLWLAPDIARGVLEFLAATQADRLIPGQDAQPGKIMHEFRSGEMAATGEIPYARYYGSADSTPLFVLLAGEYFRATGDRCFAARLWPHIERALEWMDEFGDCDRDGLIEYESTTVGGLNNQGWKDSRDCIFHANGDLAEPPIALCEVQAYAYAARVLAGEIAHALGNHTAAQKLRSQAESLQASFERQFWDEELGTYVLALDGRKQPCRVVSSNAGQCLFTGIAAPDRARRIIAGLMQPDMFSGWGLRTLSTRMPRYNPMSYHNGSVWPHDNSLVAWGMARCGEPAAAGAVLEAILDTSDFVELHRLPELLCGFERRPGEGPVEYPLTCAPQAWAAGAVFLTLRACLGLELRGDLNELRLQAPHLPGFMHHLTIKNLRLGQESLDLSLRRIDESVSVTVHRRPASVRVIVEK